METEYVDIVDEDDNVVKTVTWQEMQENGLLHRTANVLVFNSKGELFVHKRNSSLALYPNMNDVKFGGSARSSESYEECAKRELQEEAGIDNVDLKFLFHAKFRSKKNNVNRKVYECVYDGEFTLQPSEVESGRFMTLAEVKKMLAEDKLSPSGKNVFEEYLKWTSSKRS